MEDSFRAAHETKCWLKKEDKVGREGPYFFFF